MADYRTITDAEVDPDAPLTSSLGYAFRDNPIAIAEGATGAPRITDAALDSNATAAGSTWVMDRITRRLAGQIGTYVMANSGVAANLPLNTTISGGSLTPCAADGTGAGSLSGTWRLHGVITTGTTNPVSIWQRVS